MKLEGIKNFLDNERFSLSKYLAIAPAVGILIGFLGFCIHFAGCYKSTGVPAYPNEFLGVWFTSFSVLIASLSIYVLFHKGSFWPIKSNKSIWTTIAFIGLSDILGFVIFVTHLYAQQVLAVWCLTWMLYSSIVIAYLVIQVRKDKENPPVEEEISIKPTRIRRCGRCCGRTCGWILFFLAIFLMFLLAYQAGSLASDFGKFKPLGDLIEIEGENGGKFSLHIYCIGPEGAPYTYVMEHGGGASSVSWLAVQQTLADLNKRVCVYDRAGYGFSEMGELPRRRSQVASDTKKLLEKAGETGPYVLVGHSVGGQVIQFFAKYYPSDVAALVLVDSYPDYVNITAPAYGWTPAMIKNMKKATLSLLDLFRGFGLPMGITRWFVGSSDNFYPPEEEPRNKALYGTMTNWNAQYWDVWAAQKYDEEGDVDVTVGNKPVLVIPAGDTVNKTCSEMGIAEGSQSCTKELKAKELYFKSAMDQAARLSTNSSVIVCPYPCAHSMIWDKDYYLFVATQILSLGF